MTSCTYVGHWDTFSFKFKMRVGGQQGLNDFSATVGMSLAGYIVTRR